ncbi:DUF1566 domain-containing protein [Pseudomonas sp. MSSRFD41]|uniref:DUF1566 domain-containing protein n=1 Tax=Pseudomonas sp. MSSRFD41 TaxID=1310370 RepID=UPI00163A4E2D|nr:DUF1566 domain-containing protein [Pseudomonas sp. MSSRFD41]MBC2655526.1 DUF1566 domain-containing protein [Pseudomonas sp. MSSRFD41]MBC2660068.1 DUF1566 domain-containing protein [Pseudomonas sp. MSSRFD41]
MSAQENIPPAIGEIWPGQGGIYGGLRQYPEGLCHVIYAAEDVNGRHAWGSYGDKIEGTGSRTDGRANTSALIALSGKHPAAIAATSHTADGHADFYLPSVGELHHAWQYLPESFATDWYYWSSSQYSANLAYIMDFVDGWLNLYAKYRERLVRPVRRFLQ